MSSGQRSELLSGLKVVEFAQVVAGPMAGSLLADLGADVVHVESPNGGDPARVMGPAKHGVYLWWKVSGRNKRSVTLDAHTEKGREVARRLVGWADVVIASLRTSTLAAWRLDWPAVHTENPRAIMLQISGYGATSSLADAPGFGKMGEARSGVVSLTGFPDGPPIHTGFSHADSVTGLIGAYAILAALHRRNTDPAFEGEWIDVALFEPLFRLIEWQTIVYDQLGVVPTRAGNRLAVAPAAVINTYLSGSGDWITVTSATRRSVLNVVKILGLKETEFQSVEDQRRHGDLLDRHLRDWIAVRETEEALKLLAEGGVVASRIFTVADIMSDPIYAERGDIITVDDVDLGPIRMPGVIPRFDQYPGQIWRSGPRLGEDNELVLREWLGLSEEEIRDL